MRQSSSIHTHGIRVILVFVAAAVSAGCATPFTAGQARVGFDAGYLVHCRDVTPAKSKLRNTQQRLIEAKVPVSVRMLAGHETEITDLLFEVTSPEGRIRFADFSPKTQLETSISGKIKVESSTETSRLIGLNANIPLIYGATAAEDLSASHKNTSKESSTKLPPKNAVLVSGTMQNDHGIFFKLKPSTQSALEGIHDFTFTFVAPENWSGDWLLLNCRANGNVVSFGNRHIEQCGYATGYLGLCLDHDRQAREAAERLSEVQEAIARAQPEEPKTTHLASGRMSSVKTSFASLPRTLGFGHSSAQAPDKGADSDSETQSPNSAELVAAARTNLSRFAGE